MIPLWELAKYRINKLIPNSLSFEEQKALLINSDAWKCSVHQQNKHLAIDEITNDNIRGEIESAAIHWGIEMSKQYQGFRWVPFAITRSMCEIYIG